MNAKYEGLFKSSNPVRIHGGQSPDPEELPFTQLGAKIIELSELIEDKHNQAIKKCGESYKSALQQIATGGTKFEGQVEMWCPNGLTGDPSDT